MAPVTRNGQVSFANSSKSLMQSQTFREGSYDFTESEPRSDGSSEPSDDHISYNDGESEYVNEEGNSVHVPALSNDTNATEDVIYPLRDIVDRVGLEVERFAEALDEYNPMKAHNDDELNDMAFGLIDRYYEVAIETADRLREKHAADRRRKDGALWRKKMRGFKIANDPEVMDMDEAEEVLGLSIMDGKTTTVDDLDRWEEEARTWDLLKRVTRVRYVQGAEDRAQNGVPATNHRYVPERQIYNEFLQSDPLAMERHEVLRWLQDTAEESGEDIDTLVHELQQNADRGDIIAHGWLHTKAAIKNQKRKNGWPHVLDPLSSDVQKIHLNASGTQRLITQLDPDAPTRQGRALEAQDQYFERAIWLGCYELLRRGKSASDIREWCGDRTEIWRAVSICGLSGDDIDNASGPDNRSSVLWRRMCSALAKRVGTDEYERAVYGILSGDISSMEAVCQSWNEFLFANYNALLKSQFDLYLQAHHPTRLPLDVPLTHSKFDAAKFHETSQKSGNGIVDSLKEKLGFHTKVTQPLKLLQSILVADQFEQFSYRQGLALSISANKDAPSLLIPKMPVDLGTDSLDNYISHTDYDSLRVLVHILVILRNFGLGFGDSIQLLAFENIIVAYIGFLRDANKEELIPLYGTQLTGDRLYATLSRTHIDITKQVERERQIALMKDLGLNVQKFVTFQTAFVVKDNPDKSSGYPAEAKFKLLTDGGEAHEMGKRIIPGFCGRDADIDKADEQLIRSFEWFLLVDGLWSETFETGVLLYKRFFKHCKLAAARKLCRAVSAADICFSKTGPLLGENIDLNSLETGEFIDESAEDSDDPIESPELIRRYLLKEAKSFRELEMLAAALEWLETASNCINILRSGEENRKVLKDCRNRLNEALRACKDTVRPLLGDWLTTSKREEPEFKLIRETYLPEIILAYDYILHIAGMMLSRDHFLECMDISTIIASEESDLATLFVKKGRMKDLVRAFAENSKQLLGANTASSGKTGSNSKKLRHLGWTREIWDVKP